MEPKRKINPEIHTIFAGATEQLRDYIELAYSQDSPLVLDFPDVEHRKQQAALRLGYDTDDDLVAASILDLQDEYTRELVHYFLCHIQGGNTWQMVISNQLTFWEYQRMMQEPILTYDQETRIKIVTLKTKLSNDSETLARRIEGYLSEIFGELKKEKDNGEKQLRITVENMAKNVRDSRKPNI